MTHFLIAFANERKTHFDASRNISDLDDAISALGSAIELLSDTEAEKPRRIIMLYSLLSIRFSLFWGTEFQKTFFCMRSILQGIAGDTANLSSVIDFKRLQNKGDIEMTVALYEDCAARVPNGHLLKPGVVVCTADLFSKLFKYSGKHADIDKQVSYCAQALHLNADQKYKMLSILATSLAERFQSFRKISDIDEAISYFSEALNLTPNVSENATQITFNLGKALLSQYNYGGYDNALQLAIGNFHFVTSCPEAPPLERFWAACQWADNDPESKLNGYHAMIEQLPQLAWLGLPVIERHTQLFRVGSRMCEAVAYAIASQRNLVALEWAEQGRSFVWSQLLQLDAPTEEIGHQSQELAFRLMEVMKDLRSSCTRDVGGDILTRHLFDESAAQHQHRLCKQWEDLVADVRKLHGFEDFLKPMTAAQILSPNYCGYVIVINVTKSRCDALALCPGNQDVVHIPLPGFSYERATELRQLLNIQVGSGIWRYGRKAARQEEKSGLLNILSELWLRVVEPILCGLDLLSLQNTNLPRVWWCTAGPLACLPIHAAGIYDRAKTGRKVLDFVVSSYTPSVATLQHARTRVVAPKSFKMLAVAVPNAPDAPPLPNTVRELDVIQHIASSCEFLRIEGVDATTDAVLQSMADCSWVHLACHAEQDPKLDDAMQHGLLLADGRLALARIIAMSCPSADFAFLSACQTAMNDHRMPEEAAHLGAGMLAAGYRSVIATMWAIKDDVAPEVAEKVYPQLFKGSKPDSSQAAYALHNAQKEYCDSGRPLETWVPFIHLGI
ncbi:CHAT domain-containing protein [Crucibulum laeve]|uniref:CHAT domain-containing protein n=1 Tax=Crucibulum laeve TaxID=68775 RepID=A0A5C3LJ31_9AGAR|nr:CHAT domain-containing protein [Crucibulum laeve]